MFIETPYRNASLFSAFLASCRPDTLLCVATELTTQRECISTMPVLAWRANPPPLIEKKPTVFLLLAG